MYNRTYVSPKHADKGPAGTGPVARVPAKKFVQVSEILEYKKQVLEVNDYLY
jgi:hypothetical protein